MPESVTVVPNESKLLTTPDPKRSTTPSTTASPGTPTQNATPATSPANTSQNPPAVPETSGAKPTVNLAELLKDVDVDELIRADARLQGKLGALSQKQAEEKARKIADEAIAKRDAEHEAKTRADEARRADEQLKQLRDTNPVAYADATRQAEAEQARVNAFWAAVDQDIIGVLHGDLPAEIQAKVGGKRYDGTATQSRRAYLKDVLDNLVEHRLGAELDQRTEDRIKAERTRWEKEELPALLAAARSQDRGKQDSPDTGVGAPAGAVGAMAQEEFNRIRKDPGARRANKDRIAQGLAQGLIKY